MSDGVKCPYVGLDYFGEDDAELFFGRDDARRRIIGNLRASRLTLLYAQSGVGKSSLLRAGVAARLRAQRKTATPQPDSPRYLPVVFSTWREDPVASLVTEIAAAVQPFLAGGAKLELPRDCLPDAVQIAAQAGDSTLLIILDQFEELFLYHEHDEAGRRFADALALCVKRPDVRAHFLISIREDSYSRIGDHFKDRIPNVYSNYLHIDYLDEHAARAAIREPLARRAAGAGGEGEPTTIEDELVDEVLREVRRAPAAGASDGGGDGARFETAFLQLVMERVWARAKQDGSGELRLDALKALGGANAIVDSHLDDAVSDLDDRARDAAAAAFRILVTSGGSKIALTAGELSEATEQPEPLMEATLEQLRERRILRPVALNGHRSGYELFHDKLGEPVVDWRRRHEAERRKQKLLAERASEEAETLKTQRAKLMRGAATALSLLVVVLVAAVVWALVERQNAEDERKQARSQELAEKSIAQLPVDPERSIVLAREAWSTAHTRGADEALRRSLGASSVLDRFEVRTPRYARFSDDSATLFSLDAKRLFVGRPDAHATQRPPAQPPAGGARLSSHPVAGGSRLMAVATTGAAAAFSSDQGARVVRAGRGAKPVTLNRSQRYQIALSSDGRYAAGLDKKGTLRVWNADDGQIRRAFPGRTPAGTKVAFDPGDPQHVVASACNGRLTSWRWLRKRTTTLTAPPNTRKPEFAACRVAVSPDGRRAVSTLGGGLAVLGDFASRRTVSARLGDVRPVADVAFSRNGRRVAIASGKTATVIDTATGRRIHQLTGHTDSVDRITFSPAGDRLLTASSDGSARVWDVAGGTLLAGLFGHALAVLDAAFTPGGDEVLTVSSDETVRRWSVAPGRVLRGHGDWVLDAAFAPDGRRVATVDAQGGLLLRDLSADPVPTGRPARLGFRRLNSVTYDRSGERIVLAGDRIVPAGQSNAGRILVADAGNLRETEELELPDSVRTASLSRDGRWLLATTYSGPAHLWRMRDGKHSGEPFELAKMSAAYPADAAFSPDGRSIVTTSGDGNVRIFDTHTRRPKRRYPHRGVFGAAFSPDGKTVVSFGLDATAQLWTAATGRTRHVLRGHSGLIGSAAFSPDGDRVLTGGADQMTRVWEVRSGKLLSAQRMHGDYINSVAFAPDGASILSASDDRTARIYPCATCAPTERLWKDAKRRAFFGAKDVEEIVEGR